MKFVFLSLYPDALQSFFEKGLIERAVKSGKIEVDYINLRDFSLDKFKRVDDYPYGGKKGMLLKADVIGRALESIDQYSDYRLLYLSPKGERFDFKRANTYSSEKKGLIFLNGHYEGIDQRVLEKYPFETVSIGDFVLLSGETASLVIAEAVARYCEGVIGNSECIEDESVNSGRLEHPQYTAPREWQGLDVPEVLLSGHHKNVNDWKETEQLKQTLFQRPDLFAQSPATKTEQDILVNILKNK